jgi:hypothetical protein
MAMVMHSGLPAALLRNLPAVALSDSEAAQMPIHACLACSSRHCCCCMAREIESRYHRCWLHFCAALLVVAIMLGSQNLHVHVIHAEHQLRSMQMTLAAWDVI